MKENLSGCFFLNTVYRPDHCLGLLQRTEKTGYRPIAFVLIVQKPIKFLENIMCSPARFDYDSDFLPYDVHSGADYAVERMGSYIISPLIIV